MKTKKDVRSLNGEAQEHLRRQGVGAVLAGEKQNAVAKRLGVTPRTVNNWMRRHRKGGVRALRQGKRGRPRGPGRLAGWQAAYVVRAITERTPDQLKMPFVLWTRGSVADLVRTRFKVKVSRWTAGRWLRRWGLTPQKPLRRAYEQDPEAVARWLREEYPRIRRRARAEKARIYWGDQMGLRSDHQSGTTYGRRGTTPEVPGTGKRFRCNVISAVTNRGALAFRVFRCPFGASVFIEFLRRLVKHARRRVFFIVDRHPVHRSARVKRWLEARRRRIRLFLLPPYSPELNADELLNQDTKKAVGRTRPPTQPDLMRTARRHLRSRQRTPRVVRAFFREKHVRYAM